MAGMTPVSEHLSMLLSCYLDGTLSREELDEVVVALEGEEDAIAEFRRMQETRKSVRLLPLLDVPVNLMPDGHLGEELSAYLDGELATIEMPVVTSHLDTCTDCRHDLAGFDRSRTAVRALPGLEPPAFLEVNREEKKARRHGLRATAAIAAGVATVILAFTIGPFSSAPEPTSISISDLQSRHTAVASLPSSGVAVQVTNSP